MGDDQEGNATLLVQPAEHAQDVLAGLRVEVSSGFVGQEQDRVVGKGPGNRDSLALPCGELVRQVILAVTDPRAIQQLGGFLDRSRAVNDPSNIGIWTFSRAVSVGSKWNA